MKQSLQNFSRLCSLVTQKRDGFRGSWYIPADWDAVGFGGAKDASRPGELSVNPYAFFLACAQRILDAAQADAQPAPALAESTIYSILPRAYTAWRHGGDGAIAPGTLFKTMLVLPRLKRFGVNILYLLPVFRIGRAHRKGDLGSPYAIRDFSRIDEGLHDPLLGPCSDELLDTEFRAFVEACHALGIRVMVDFAFRTVARDNVLIGREPDWFYWIKKDREAGFAAPSLPGCKGPLGVNRSTLPRLYRSPELPGYLDAFTPSPRQLDPERWEHAAAGDPDTLLERVEKAFGVTVMPGFSDMLGDTQPPWTDVTYLRYYFDNAPEVRGFLRPGQPPYLMQDGASLGLFHGERKNTALWEYVADIMPAYARDFGIDGARIDMAHALPTELSVEIIRRIRALRPDFLLWSEELGASGGAQAKKDGFDLISGFSYAAYKRAKSAAFNRSLLQEEFLRSALPIAASLETPDTPRSAQILGDPALLRVLALLNAFVPNGIPCLNCGQELTERQPMNLGLDNDESGRFVLPQGDPMYGRLAFFDTCCLHWTAPHAEMEELFTQAARLRARYIAAGLLKSGNFVPQPEFYGNRKLTLLCYRDAASGRGLLFIANRSQRERARLPLSRALPQALRGAETALAFRTDGGETHEPLRPEALLTLQPCSAAFLEFTVK